MFWIKGCGAAQVKKVEADISAVRQSDLLEHPIAGQFRRKDIMKGTTCLLIHSQISEKLKELLKELHSEKVLKTTHGDVFFQHATYYFAELNYSHPFREGNGRTQRLYFRQLAQ